MFKVAYYEMKKMLRDYRLLIVFLLQPIILVYLLGNTAAHDPKDMQVSLFNRYDNTVSSQIVQKIEESSKLKVTEFNSEDEARKEVRDNKSKLAVILSIKGNYTDKNEVNFITNATVPEISAAAQSEVAENIYSFTLGKNLVVSTEKNTDREINFFSYYASAIIILLLILIGLNASVTSITQERVDGTFERFFVTPYSKMSMVFGKMVSYVGISLILALIMILSMKFFFDVSMGPIWLVGLVTFVTGLAATALGILISSFTYTIDESIQVGTLVFFAILVLTGLIFQPETMQPIIAKIHALIPFTYAMTGMREVNILGFGFIQVYRDILILFGSSILFLLIAVLALRRKAN